MSCDAYWCHVMYTDAMWCILMSCDVYWCHVMHTDVMWCILMSCDAYWCHVMHTDVTWCILISCDVYWWHVMYTDVMWCILMSCDVYWRLMWLLRYSKLPNIMHHKHTHIFTSNKTLSYKPMTVNATAKEKHVSQPLRKRVKNHERCKIVKSETPPSGVSHFTILHFYRC